MKTHAPLVLGIETSCDETPVGSAVAIGVLVDTLLVRSVLAPSLILKMDDATWWPWNPAVTHPGTARWQAAGYGTRTSSSR
jgi:uncharacterized membrane protein YdfJ with MMPL/SSD domain